MSAPDRFRQIPSVTSLLARDDIRSLLAHHPRAVVLGAIRELPGRAAGSSNLEFDLAGGTRSRRLVHVEQMLLALTGAESVHVVNNNAAAVFLCLTGLARGREVIVSRGALAEIGGSFPR